MASGRKLPGGMMIHVYFTKIVYKLELPTQFTKEDNYTNSPFCSTAIMDEMMQYGVNAIEMWHGTFFHLFQPSC